MTDPVIIYHWWADEEERPAYSNLSHPVLLSIATLRAVNPTIPIKVLNCSSYLPEWDTTTDPWRSSDWLHFMEKFDFQVWGSRFSLEKHSNVAGYNLLSRLFDLRSNYHSQWPVIYCDSDVLWLRDPLPLACDINKFCFDGFNSGFFYYDYNSTIVQDMFEVFDAYTIAALNDKQFCQIIKDKTNYDAWPYIWDETILNYMNQTGFSDMFEIVPLEEHTVMRRINEVDPAKMKMLHCNGMILKNPIAKRVSERDHSRGLACLLFKEFYDNITKVLDDADMRLIFTERELDNCLPNQISLFDHAKIRAARTEDGHYQFDATNRIPESPWLI